MKMTPKMTPMMKVWFPRTREEMLIVEMLRLKLAEIEARLALRRKEKKLQQLKKKGDKSELSTLQVPQSPQKNPPKRTL